MRYEGGCFCGAVRYAADAEPVNELICHCRTCQKAIGAAFNARILFRREDVAISGEPVWFKTSDDLDRGFCGACGTTLFSARASRGVLGVTTGSLDDPSLFRPTHHIWVSARQPWLCLDDGLEESPGPL